MKPARIAKVLAIAGVAVACLSSPHTRAFAAEAAADSSAVLPPEYAKNFLIAESTRSPDGKYAVMYPTLDYSDAAEAKDYVVAVEPFAPLGALPTKWPYFQNKNHGGISAEWSDDSTVALITLESKWGPGDVFLVEIADGKMKRTTNLLKKVHQLALPKYRSAKPKPQAYNDEINFIFEQGDEPVCQLDGTNRVKIDATATTDPKGISSRAWTARVTAVWDIQQARFVSHKITSKRRTAADRD